MNGAKIYLQQLGKLDVMIRHDIERIEELKAAATRIGGASYEDRVQSSRKTGDAGFVSAVVELCDIEEKRKQEVTELTKQKEIIISQITGMSDAKQIEVLYQKYVEFKELTDIAKELDRSVNTVSVIHGRALQSFGKMYKKEIDAYLKKGI